MEVNGDNIINNNHKLNQNIIFSTSLLQHYNPRNTGKHSVSDSLKENIPVFYLQGAVHHADDVVKLLGV